MLLMVPLFFLEQIQIMMEVLQVVINWWHFRGLGIDCEIHACGPAMRQLMAGKLNFYEVNLVHSKCKKPLVFPIYNEQYSDQLDCIDENGNVKVSDQV